ncbi:MAG: class I adenylate-forming enzyme family protein [Reyranellaceae bacterium]
MSLSFQHDCLCSDAIAHHAKFSPRHPAVICGDRQLNWAEFDRRTNKVANALLSRGLRTGDKVCLLMQNSIAMFELLWGAIKAGGVIVPLNLMMARDTLVLMVNNCEARLLFADAETIGDIAPARAQLSHIDADGLFAAGGGGASWRSTEAFIEAASDQAPDVRLKPEDSINIIYTSGTTGVPKGVEHSHFARFAYAFGLGSWLNFDRNSIAIAATPLYANGTWMTMLPCLYRGGTIVLMPKFSGEAFVATVERTRATHTFLVPTQSIGVLEALAGARRDMGSLRVLISAGQALPPKTYRELVAALPECGVYEAYGMSEGFGTLAWPEDLRRGEIGLVGKPFFLDDICIIDEHGREVPPGQDGEIVGYSGGLMKGYYRDKARTEEMIWIGPRGRTYLRSGDVGRIDEDGFVRVLGRIKDMIKSGGINVYASDIEAAFMAHPQVREVAAIGIPHEKWGETPLLFAILQQGASLTEEELRDWGNRRLSKFQRVARVEFREDFPRANYDKVKKADLRAPYWAGRERAI